jgi:hypothetical protein
MGRNVGSRETRGMPRLLHRLSAVRVKTLKEPGYYADGGNLYLQVTRAAARAG